MGGAVYTLMIVELGHRLAGAAQVHLAELAGEDFISFPADVGTDLPGVLRALCRRPGSGLADAGEALIEAGLLLRAQGTEAVQARIEPRIGEHQRVGCTL